MNKCFFVSDLHGKENRYYKLFDAIKSHKPEIVFIGGDIYPPFNVTSSNYKKGFLYDFLLGNLSKLKRELKSQYPKIYIILGNDDPKTKEHLFYNENKNDLLEYINNRKTKYQDFDIYGYSNIPPTPFIYKDWELYDVSRYVDPGCIHPTEGKRSLAPDFDVEFTTIKQQLEELTLKNNLSKSIFLFHSPPYKTKLDRAALDGMFFDHVPLDVHIGSIAIKDFIENKSPYITLHGHVHESTRITGEWKEKINNTWSFNAATDKNKLSLIIFELNNPAQAERKII